MAEPKPLFPMPEASSVQPRRPRSLTNAATARPVEQALSPAPQLQPLRLTPRDEIIQLEGTIGLPAEKFAAATAVFAKNGIKPGKAATEGFCVTHTVLAELELTGRPMVVTFRDREFIIEPLPRWWERLKFWRR